MSETLRETSAPLGEIVQGPNKFEQFLDRNQKGLAILAVLLVLAALGLVIQRGIETSHQESAGAELVKADNLAGYQTLVDSNRDTVAGGSAMVLLADRQWADNKRDESIATLEKFIASSPDHAAIPSAKASLGAKLLAQGKTGEATKVFEGIIGSADAKFIAPYALLSLGDIALAAGDTTKAKESYAKITDDFPDSPFGQTANQRISSLTAKPPVEIDAPPVAPLAPTVPPAPGAAPMEDVPPVSFPLTPNAAVPPVETPVPESPAPTPVVPEQ